MISDITSFGTRDVMIFYSNLFNYLVQIFKDFKKTNLYKKQYKIGPEFILKYYLDKYKIKYITNKYFIRLDVNRTK